MVRGSFCNWEGEDYILERIPGEHTYTGVFSIPGDSGQQVEYKYAILKPDGKVCYETRANPDDLPFGNRKVTLTGLAQQLPEAVYITNPYRLAWVGKKVEFSQEELQADFKQFRKALEEKHGSLYRYTPRHSMDSLFDAQYRKIRQAMTPPEFFRILTPVIARIGCGHTGIWMPGDFWDMGPDKLFPLKIRIFEGEPVVTGSYLPESPVPPGSILLAINGREVKDILAEMLENKTADALNRESTAGIERRFSMFHARRFGFSDSYTTRYLPPGQTKVLEKKLEPAGIEAVRAVVFANFNYPDPGLSFLPEAQAAVLVVPSFIFYDRRDYFCHFLDSCFALIRDRGVKKLVLDLRGNDGGDPRCAAHLFSFLEKQPEPYFAAPYRRYAALAEPVSRAENAFEGELVILMDGFCFSTCSHLVSLLKYHRLGPLVGVPSAGMYTCNGGGGNIRLVYTRMQLIYTERDYAVAVRGMPPDQPIYPDIPVNETREDFLAGRDVYLEAALGWMKDK